MSWRIVGLGLAAVLVGALSAWAETATPDPGTVAPLVAVVVPTAGALAAPTAEPMPSPAPTTAPFTAGYKDGFFLQTASGDYRLKITGYVQADGRFALSDDAGAVTDSLLLRSVRPQLQGTVARYFDFYLSPDFGGGTPSIQDAYVDVHFGSAVRVRVGKVTTPFGLERVQSNTNLLFVERALPNNLAPNRDVGFQVWGEPAQGVITYSLGVFDGVPDGGSSDGDTNDQKDAVGRVFLQPWRTTHTSPLRGLGFGFAVTRGRASGALPTYRSVAQAAIFSYVTGASTIGDRTRLSPQVYYFGGPVGIVAEYIQSQQEVTRQDAQHQTLTSEMTHKSWSVTGSVLVTGEASTYGTVKPKSFFVPQAGTWGAVQLVARINRLDMDPVAFDGGFADPTKSVKRATAYGAGVNWYWNNNVKFVVNYEQTKFQGGAAAGANRSTEKSVQTRLQLMF